MEQGIQQCARSSDTDGGYCTAPAAPAEQSHGLWAAGAMAKQNHQSKNVHWLRYGTDCLSHIYWEKQIHCFPTTGHLPFLFTYIASLILALPHGVTHE